jgi:hypothetical protein
MIDMKLRSRLYLLVAGALTPMAVFAIVVALLLVQHERETLERDAVALARAAMSAVDAHLRGSIASLQSVATSKALEAGDFAAFHAESQRVLRTQPAWVNLSLVSAEKLVISNAVYALGKPEPLAPVEESFNVVVRTARPAIGNVMAGVVVQSPTVRVRVPVVYGDKVRYTLSAPLNLKYLADNLLKAQRLPEGWVITLVDRDTRVIARLPAVATGLQEADDFRDATKGSLEGWFQGRSMEGRTTYTSYVRSQLSGWVLGIAIPAETVEAGARSTFATLGIGVLAAFAIGMLLAWLIGSRISQ